MPGRADRFGLIHRSCDDVVAWPFRTELIPEGQDLRLRYYRQANGEMVCDLRLEAPSVRAHLDAFPKVIIKSTIFSCSSVRWQG